MNNTNNDKRRQLLMEKYASIYTSGFSEKEIIELLILTLCPNKNIDKIVKPLTDHFGVNFLRIIDSPPDEIMRIAGLNSQRAEFIHMIPKIARIYNQKLMTPKITGTHNQEPKDKNVTLTNSNIGKYAINLMLHRKEETFYLISLNKESKIIAENIISQGTATSVTVNLKEFSKALIASNAFAVILIHNHPGGKTAPSAEDVDMTKYLIEYARNLNVTVIDHIIVNDKAFYSMRSDKPYIFLK